jgi:hypothetical protein
MAITFYAKGKVVGGVKKSSLPGKKASGTKKPAAKKGGGFMTKPWSSADITRIKAQRKAAGKASPKKLPGLKPKQYKKARFYHHMRMKSALARKRKAQYGQWYREDTGGKPLYAQGRPGGRRPRNHQRKKRAPSIYRPGKKK